MRDKENRNIVIGIVKNRMTTLFPERLFLITRHTRTVLLSGGHLGGRTYKLTQIPETYTTSSLSAVLLHSYLGRKCCRNCPLALSTTHTFQHYFWTLNSTRLSLLGHLGCSGLVLAVVLLSFFVLCSLLFFLRPARTT